MSPERVSVGEEGDSFVLFVDSSVFCVDASIFCVDSSVFCVDSSLCILCGLLCVLCGLLPLYSVWTPLCFCVDFSVLFVDPLTKPGVQTGGME